MRNRRLTEEQLNEYRRIAYYYYVAGFTQDVIARKMSMSRQRVNRIIRMCRELGIVNIKIEGLENTNLKLESAIEMKYGLDKVRIIDDVSKDDLYNAIGRAAGDYLKSILKNGQTIGFSGGRAASAVADYWGPENLHLNNLKVTQLMGSSVEKEIKYGVSRVVNNMAEILGADPIEIFAPLTLTDSEMLGAIKAQPDVTRAFEVAKNCDIAVTGIGLPDEAEINAAGSIAAHLFDAEGNEVVPADADRILRLSREDYLGIPIRIGIAGGNEKIDAIIAAAKGKYISVLVTDKETANILLEK